MKEEERAALAARLKLGNLSFRHSRGDKVLTFQYLNGWHETGECSVGIDSDGNIVIREKIKEEDYEK